MEYPTLENLKISFKLDLFKEKYKGLENKKLSLKTKEEIKKALKEIYGEKAYKKEQYRLKDMKRRCYDEKNKDFIYYGKRGIKICQNWLDEPIKFYAFALLNGSNFKEMTIDRINRDGDYEPNNVQFITRYKNCTTKFFKDSKQSQPIFRYYSKFGGLFQIQYSYKMGFLRDTIKNRIKANWSLYEALNIPIGVRRNTFWQKIKKLPNNEIFINYKDQRALYLNDQGLILCPKCSELSFKLKKNPYYLKCGECGFTHILQSKEK